MMKSDSTSSKFAAASIDHLKFKPIDLRVRRRTTTADDSFTLFVDNEDYNYQHGFPIFHICSAQIDWNDETVEQNENLQLCLIAFRNAYIEAMASAQVSDNNTELMGSIHKQALKQLQLDDLPFPNSLVINGYRAVMMWYAYRHLENVKQSGYIAPGKLSRYELDFLMWQFDALLFGADQSMCFSDLKANWPGVDWSSMGFPNGTMPAGYRPPPYNPGSPYNFYQPAAKFDSRQPGNNNDPSKKQ